MTLEELKTAEKSFSRMGWMLLVFLVLGSVFQAGVASLVSAMAPALLETSWGFWVLSYLPLYIALPLALLCVRKLPKEPPEDHAMSLGKWLGVLAICIFLTYLGNFVGIGINALITSISGGSLESMNPLANIAQQGGILWRTLVLAVAAPVVEELIFRRTVLNRLRIYGEKTALLVSAMLFALFHANFSQLFYAFLLGLLFGYVYLRTGRIRYSIALHMVINFIGSVLSVVLTEKAGLDGDLDLSAMMAGNINPGMVGLSIYGLFIVVMFVVGLILFLLWRKDIHFEPVPRELPVGTRAKTALGNPGIITLIVVCVILMGLITLGLSTGMAG